MGMYHIDYMMTHDVLFELTMTYITNFIISYFMIY